MHAPSRPPVVTYGDAVHRAPTEVVYLEYDPRKLPSKPSAEWTRFICISDTHSRTFEVPDGDVLLHSGDLTNTGTVKEFEKTMEWLYSLPHEVKIIIAGNHDLTLDKEWYEHNHPRFHRITGIQNIEPILEMLKGPRAQKAGLVYLQNEKHEFQVKENGRVWSVYGSPWSPEFLDWAFNYSQQQADGMSFRPQFPLKHQVIEWTDLIFTFPKTDILQDTLSTPCVLDKVLDGSEVGCEALRARLPILRPRLHLFGHIHEAHGAQIVKWDPVNVQSESLGAELADAALDRTVFVNAANWPMGENAHRGGVRTQFGGPGFQPVLVDLKD